MTSLEEVKAFQKRDRQKHKAATNNRRKKTLVLTLIRETNPDKKTGYRVYDNGRGSIVIKAKEKAVLSPQKSLYLRRHWDARVWRELQRMTDAAFNGSCCLELGIGAFAK